MAVRDVVTIEEAAGIVGVSRRTIYNWIARRKVQFVRTASGSIRVYVDTLYQDAGENQPIANLDAKLFLSK